MRVLAKMSGNVGLKASSVLNKWRDVVATTPKSNETCLKENAYPKAITDHTSSKLSHKDEKTSKKHSVDKHFKDKHCKKEKHIKEKSYEKEDAFIKSEHLKEKIKTPSKEKHSKEKQPKEKFSKETCGIEFKLKQTKDKKKIHTSVLFCESKPAKVNDVNSSNKKKYDKDKKQDSPYKGAKRLKYESNSEKKNFNGEDSEYDDEYPNLSFNGGNDVSYDSESAANSDSYITNEPIHKKSKIETCSSPIKELSIKLHRSSSPSSCKISKKSSDSEHLTKKKSSKGYQSSVSNSSIHDSSDSEHLTKKKSSKVYQSSVTNSSIDKSSKAKLSSDKIKEKKLSKKGDTEGFTSSETTFEDCLSFNDSFPRKKKKAVIIPLKKSKEASKSLEKDKQIKTSKESFPKKTSREKETVWQVPAEPAEKNIPTMKTIDVSSTLPQTQPNYRPLPQRSYEYSPIKKQENPMSNEEAIKFTSSRREKTAVYSGKKNKHSYLTEVPSLFESCTRVLIDNIDGIEYMGGIPYFLLESMLKRCSPSQLYRIEDYNPYLLEDTNELWETHCKRDYRIAKRQESETWRELYWRSHDEREQRLRSVTANISASIANSNPTRKAKLAYVDSVVKPPRDVARRQAKNGTALPISHVVKAGPPSKASPRPTAPSINSASAAAVSVPISRPRVEVIKPMKPKVAPLMAKTLKSMKQCFRR